jgi:peptidoglycan hydrolase FlgJ
MSSVVPLQKMDTNSPAYKAMYKQAQGLEANFINTLMKEMFSSIKTDDKSFGGGFAEDTWRGMQAEQLSDSIAKNGGLGIARSMMGDLMQLQEAAPKTKTGV